MISWPSRPVRTGAGEGRMEKEVRSVSPTGGRKGTKLCRPDLIPARAHLELALHYGHGAQKYTEYDEQGNMTHEGGNNWRLGYEWSKSIAALERHILAFKDGEDFDEEFGSKHVIAAAWHCLTLATFMDEHPEFDDRWCTRSRDTRHPQNTPHQ
jgi:hypothetical protein